MYLRTKEKLAKSNQNAANSTYKTRALELEVANNSQLANSNCNQQKLTIKE